MLWLLDQIFFPKTHHNTKLIRIFITLFTSSPDWSIWAFLLGDLTSMLMFSATNYTKRDRDLLSTMVMQYCIWIKLLSHLIQTELSKPTHVFIAIKNIFCSRILRLQCHISHVFWPINLNLIKFKSFWRTTFINRIDNNELTFDLFCTIAYDRIQNLHQLGNNSNFWKHLYCGEKSCWQKPSRNFLSDRMPIVNDEKTVLRYDSEEAAIELMSKQSLEPISILQKCRMVFSQERERKLYQTSIIKTFVKLNWL